MKRFLNRDVLRGEITDGQTFNRFAYVNGDPVQFIDPLGLMKQCKKPIKENEVTTYKDFYDRSVVGDNLEGHEVWQHANLKAKGHATSRLSTDASKKNPVIALEKSKHKEVNKAQRSFNAANQTARQNIEANAKILRDAGIPQKTVNKIVRKAVRHAQDLGEM